MINQIEPVIERMDIEEVIKYMETGAWLTEHKVTEEAEKFLSAYLGVKHCILTTSGTSALMLSLLAVERTTAVIPAYTMIATANAAAWADYDIQFVDTDDLFCMDLDILEDIHPNAISTVVYVSINGRCGDMERLLKICHDNKWTLVEDACQSFSSRYKGKYIGTFGDVGCYSLSPHKIITTGQGGIIVTDNDILARRIRGLKDHGRNTVNRERFDSVGLNLKYNDLHATLLLSQLATLPLRRSSKQKMYKQYEQELNDIVTMISYSDPGWVPWFVDIQSEHTDAIINKLTQDNIQTKQPYLPIPMEKAYSHHSYCKCTNAVRMFNNGLWLPSSLTLSTDDINTICNNIKTLF